MNPYDEENVAKKVHDITELVKEIDPALRKAVAEQEAGKLTDAGRREILGAMLQTIQRLYSNEEIGQTATFLQNLDNSGIPCGELFKTAGSLLCAVHMGDLQTTKE